VLTNQGLDALPQPSVDGNELATKVSDIEAGLHSIGRGAGNDGPVERFQFSVQTLSAIADHEAKKPGRKLLIWAGPGWPIFDSSRPPVPSKAQLQFFFDTIVQLSTRLREASISVYSVSQGTGYSISQGTSDRRPISAQSEASPFRGDHPPWALTVAANRFSDPRPQC
jgi:hypothetical protein